MKASLAMEAVLSVDGRPCTFSCEPDDPWLKIWRDLGFYGAKRDIVPYRLAIRPEAICLDIGANIGLTAAVMGNLCPLGRVYCFEPVAKNFVHLRRTIELNNLVGCEAIRAAVGAKDGTIEIEAHGPHSHVSSYRTPATETVELLTLDSWVARRNLDRLDFIKIDVEGHERAVLEGAKECLARFRPTVFVEFNSLTTVMIARVTPWVLLDELMAMFPFVAVVDRESGALNVLGRSEAERADFVGKNMTTGFIDDLMCYFDPSQMANIS